MEIVIIAAAIILGMGVLATGLGLCYLRWQTALNQQRVSLNWHHNYKLKLSSWLVCLTPFQ